MTNISSAIEATKKKTTTESTAEPISDNILKTMRKMKDRVSDKTKDIPVANINKLLKSTIEHKKTLKGINYKRVKEHTVLLNEIEIHLKKRLIEKQIRAKDNDLLAAEIVEILDKYEHIPQLTQGIILKDIQYTIDTHSVAPKRSSN